ncbi:hypothetical protein VDGL01_00295 [Verticillium dahliae]
MEKRISDFARWEAGVWLERKDGGFLRNQWSLHALENGTLVVNRVKPRDHKAAARNRWYRVWGFEASNIERINSIERIDEE